MTFKQLICSKRFWTLIAGIVAALTAFFTFESCSGYKFVRSNGLHCDTVYQESYVKFREMNP